MVIRGKILDLITLGESVMQVVIQAKHDEKYFPIAFIAFKSTVTVINQIGLEKRDTVKLEYYLKSKKWDDKYTTSAIIENIKILEKAPLQLLVDTDTGEIF